MRVLVVTNMYPPHAYGGYEQSCRDVVERWRAAGHVVEVLTSTVRVPGVDLAEAEEGVRRRLRIYWENHEILNPALCVRWAAERANHRVLAEVLADVRPEVVSVWAMGAMSFGLLSDLERRDLPMVSVICDEWPIYGPDTDAWLRPLVRRPALARVVGALTGLPTKLPDLDGMGPACFVSAHLRDSVRRKSPWRFPHATVVPSGVHLEEFPLAAKPDGPWRWRMLYVGRIDPRKGIDTAVEALAKCPAEATLEVHGSGDDRHKAELEALADGLGVGGRVSFTVTPRHELAAVYRRADVVVFPSRWEEPFGLVPLEAMASGTPVVGTAVGGAAEFLDDGRNCLVFAPGDVDGLVEQLVHLAGEPELVRTVVRGGLDTAGRFGVDRLAADLWRLHEGAVPGSVGCRNA